MWRLNLLLLPLITTLNHDRIEKSSLPLSVPPAAFGGDPLRPLPCKPFVARSESLPKLPVEPPSSYTAIHPLYFTHKFSINSVAKAFYSKYPCADCPDVLSVTVVDEQFDPNTDVKYFKRLLTIRNSAPWLFRQMLNSETVTFTEYSLLDLNNGVLEICSRNSTFSNILLATEHSKFYRDPHDANQTHFVQTGGISAGSWFGPLREQLEQFIAPAVRAEGVRAILLLDKNLSNNL